MKKVTFNDLDNHEQFKFLENLRTLILSEITTKFQVSCKGDVKSMLALRGAVSGFDELTGKQIATIGLGA